MVDKTVTERRLAAIVAIDVAGYTRLMERDEPDTGRRWLVARQSIIEPVIAARSGQLQQSQGDALILLFPNAVDAVGCAVDIQKGMIEAGKAETPDRRIRLRIGIHLGDVVMRDGAIEGHGVNVAVRLETASDIDGILVSAAVREAVKAASPVSFVDAGMQEFRNMSPMQAYRVEPAGDRDKGAPAATPAASGVAHKPIVSALAARSYAMPLIAVLRHGGTTAGSHSDSLVDTIREALITTLSGMGWFTTLPRSWQPAVALEAPVAPQYFRDAGIRYVVSVGVRRSGGRVRATTELIETGLPETAWAEMFDGSLAEPRGFGFVDRVVRSVVSAIEPVVRRIELARISAKPVEALNSYELVARAMPMVHGLLPTNFVVAEGLLRRAVDLDDESPWPLAASAWARLLRIGQGGSEAPAKDILEAHQLARGARERDESNYFAQAVSGHVAAFLQHDLESSPALLAEALRLNPRSAFAWTRSSVSHSYLGDTETALTHARHAIKASRASPHPMFASTAMTLAYMVGRDYEQAVVWGRRAMQANANYTAVLRMLAASLAHTGRIEEAQRVARHTLTIEPTFRISTFNYPLKRRDDLLRYIDGLQKAGMPL